MAEDVLLMDWLAENHNERTLPRSAIVKRSVESGYPFNLLVREYRMILKVVPNYFTFKKAEEEMVKATLEERSLFGGTSVIVLKGFSGQFLSRLKVADDKFVVAEATDMGMVVKPYFHARSKPPLMKVLKRHLGMHLSVQEMVRLDWSPTEDWSDAEPILRRSKILGLSADETEKEIGVSLKVNLMQELKKGNRKELIERAEELGWKQFWGHLGSVLADFAVYVASRQLGIEPEVVARSMDLSYLRAGQFKEAQPMFSPSDLRKVVARYIKLDELAQSKPSQACILMVSDAGVSVK